jgi:DNA-binding Lrp family transcriptional regulator
MQNSRRTYRELAEILNLSINAVHKRIQELIKIGILRDFTAKIDLSTFEMSIVAAWVWGRSECKSLDEIITKLVTNSSIYWISFVSGIFFFGFLVSSANRVILSKPM